jgi:hypothetical protein
MKDSRIKRFFIWSSIVSVLVMVLLPGPLTAEEVSGNATVRYQNTTAYEDNTKISSSVSKSGNFNLALTENLTTSISYQLYIRGDFRDVDTTNKEGERFSKTEKTLNPSVELSLRNPTYGIRVGYRHDMRWRDLYLKKIEETKRFYYSELSITPFELPSLRLRYDKLEEDFGEEGKDQSSEEYSIRSDYKFRYRGLVLKYYISYSRGRERLPTFWETTSVERQERDSFNGSYEVSYSKHFWKDALAIFVRYKGSYSKSKQTQFVSEPGEAVVKRFSVAGLYAEGTLLEPEVEQLDPEPQLVDGDVYTGISNINLKTKKYNNIGIEVSATEDVDRLMIYVKGDISLDIILIDTSKWLVYRSDSNLPGAVWTQITLKSVKIQEYDVINNIYVYELQFVTSYQNSYYKVINLDFPYSTDTDVIVTEIEAYGSELFPESKEKTTENESSIQEVNLSLTYKFKNKVIATVGFFVKQSDSGDISIGDSMKDVFKNIYGDEKGAPDKYSRRVTRFYNMAVTWYAHRLLTVRGGINLTQEFDNANKRDFEGYTYNLTLSSSPVSTFTTSLFYTHFENYNFGDKRLEQDTIAWGITSEIYRNVEFTNDIGFSISSDKINNTETKLYFVSGSVNARLRSTLFTYLNYNIGWSSSNGESSSSQEVLLTVTYTPGRLLNITGNFQLTNSGGRVSTSEGIGIYWRFLPALHYSLTYQLTTGDTTLHAFNTSIIWYTTRFLRFQLNYGYTLLKDTIDKKTHNLLLTLTGRI